MVLKMFRNRENDLLKEDEELSGEGTKIVNKKNPRKTVPYSDFFD